MNVAKPNFIKYIIPTVVEKSNGPLFKFGK